MRRRPKLIEPAFYWIVVPLRLVAICAAGPGSSSTGSSSTGGVSGRAGDSNHADDDYSSHGGDDDGHGACDSHHNLFTLGSYLDTTKVQLFVSAYKYSNIPKCAK